MPPKRKQLAKKKVNVRRRRKDDTVFRFLDLPVELRLKIYDLLLVDDYKINVREKKYQTCRRTCRRDPETHTHSLDTKVLRLNKQIYLEAAPILYEENAIRCSDPTDMYSFLCQISPLSKTWITELSLKEWPYGNSGIHGKSYLHPALTMLSTLPNLEALFFDSCLTTILDPDMALREIVTLLYQYGHTWLEHVGRVKGDKAAGADLIHGLRWYGEGDPPPRTPLTRFELRRVRLELKALLLR